MWLAHLLDGTSNRWNTSLMAHWVDGPIDWDTTSSTRPIGTRHEALDHQALV